MKSSSTSQPVAAGILDRLLDGFASKLTPGTARALVDFRIEDEDRERIRDLADKCNEGLLTPEEKQEYEDYIRAGDLITLLQSKARLYLKRNRRS